MAHLVCVFTSGDVEPEFEDWFKSADKRNGPLEY